MRAPAFQFYVDDFVGGTMNFTDAEIGLYVRLLTVQWSNGSIPDDDKELASYSRGETPLQRVKLKFKKCADGRLRNTRMEIERKKQNKFRKSRAINGKLGGRPCKASDNLVVNSSLPVGKPSESSPSPISVLLSPDVQRESVRLHGIPAKVEEVIEAGKLCNPMKDETTCRAFWSHYEGQARINPSGALFWITTGDTVVTNWKAKLSGFGNAKPQAGPSIAATPAAETVYAMKTRLEAKRDLRQKLRNRGNETPTGFKYRDDTDRAEAKKLKEEIEELERKLAQ